MQGGHQFQHLIKLMELLQRLLIRLLFVFVVELVYLPLFSQIGVKLAFLNENVQVHSTSLGL